MSVIEKASAQTLSKEELQQAVKYEKVPHTQSVELNELASSVAEQFAKGTISAGLLSGVVGLIDFLSLSTISLLLLAASNSAGVLSSVWNTIGAFSIAGLAVFLCQTFYGYQVQTLKQYVDATARATAGLVISLGTIAVAQTIFSDASQGANNWLLAVLIVSNFYFLASRSIIYRYVHDLSDAGRLKRRAVIVGGGSNAAELIKSLKATEDSDIEICGIFDDREDARSPSTVGGYQKLGTIAELISFARTASIDMMIVSLPVSAEKRVLQLMKRLWVLPVDIRLAAHTDTVKFRPRSFSYEGSVPMVDVIERPIANWDAFAKRAFDIVGASAAIVLLSPIMLIAAIAVRLDSEGPVIFKQKREGFNNDEIEIYKFRSLYTDMGDKSGINVVTKGDSRVTRVGRFIRKTSIDELPQLFNVLQGRLSLVGPRPHVANARTDDRLWAEVVDSYIARHKVKPGVTGWAQITGWRGEIDNDDKLEGRVNADLYYIENWSLLFDMYILALTPFRLMNTENAY